MTARKPSDLCQDPTTQDDPLETFPGNFKAFGGAVLQSEDDCRLWPLHQRASEPDDDARRGTA